MHGKKRIETALRKLERELLEFIARNKRDANVTVGKLGAPVFFDGCEYRERVLHRIIAERRADLNRCVVVEPPTQTQTLAVGHVVTLRLYENNGERDVTFELGGYGDSNPSTSPEIISYKGALTCDLYGCRVGNGAVVKRPGSAEVEIEVEIVKIALPTRSTLHANTA